MKNLQKIVQKGIGIIFGLFLVFIWIILITKMGFYFLGESIIVHDTEIVKISSQAFSWFRAGLIPFFIIAGHYLFYSNIIGGIEKTKDIIAMKSIFVSYTIWLIICVITDLLNMHNLYIIHFGYLIMFIIYLMWKYVERI
ncbi:MAG: hypothetical protein LWW97_12240 [Deltaproteobacteria bacterium]|nr:hypothetical protein [Deltaproteobacteria bacterium]